MGCLAASKEKTPSVHSPAPTVTVTHQLHYTDIRFKYDFLKSIGKGHYGTVYLACLKNRPSDLVAVKTLIRKRAQSSQERLEREIRILFSLDHPNIVRLYEVFEDKKYVHLVTEYCSGGELFDHIVAMGRYSEMEAARLLHKMLLAVNNLHHNNVCHRDLKPENFMFEDHSENAEVKLIDFGLSNKFFDKFANKELVSFVGTPEYVAPEVIQGGYGQKCDIWSVGVLMYVMLSGKLPFSAGTVPATLARIMTGEFPLPEEIWGNVSPMAIDLLRRLLVVSPEARLSADEALSHPWFSDYSGRDISPSISRDIISSLKAYRVTSKLQSEAYNIIVKCLNVRQIGDMKTAFLSLDKEKKGYLSFDQLQEGLRCAGFEMAANEIHEILANADFMQDGRINYSEFLAATLESRTLLDEITLGNAFSAFDVDNTGYITEENVKEALQRTGRKVSEVQVREMMREAGAGKQGLSFTEFKQLVRQASSAGLKVTT